MGAMIHDLKELKSAVQKALKGANYGVMSADQKAVNEDSTVSGDGLIYPDQRDKYYQYLRAPRPSIIPAMRFERLATDRMDLDKIMIGQPVTDWPDDDQTDAETSNVLIGGTVPIAAKKARVSTRVTYRSFRRNIEGAAVLDTIAAMTAARSRYDMELVALRGDTTISGTDRVSKLLKKIDGIGVKTNSSKVLSQGGANLGETMFDDGFLALPDEAKQDPDLAWVMSPNARVIWNKIMRGKVGANADQAQRGEYRIGPHGFRMIETPAIPSNLGVTIAGGSPGRAVSAVPGPYRIQTGSKNIRLNIAGVGLTADIDVSGGKADGKWTALQIAKRINDYLVANTYGATYANCASADSEGNLVITALNNNDSVIVTAGSTADAVGALTLTPATNSGAASSGTSYKGSYILLANPMNFIFAMTDNIRAYTKYWPERDFFGLYQYQEVDVAVEDADKVVKLTNFLCQ